MPREITRIELDTIYTQEDRPYQVREFNYVFSYDAIDSETGAQIAANEFRTVASDEPLTLDEAKDKITELIETEQT
jgi:hypothetical protein